MQPHRQFTPQADGTALSFIWLEITGKCQLQCVHCYAESGPHATHGTMTQEDWKGVISEAAGLGTTMVQFIGGEPTLHLALPELVAYALEHGLEVEIFSNLVRISPRLWEVFGQPGVRLATSYYAADARRHETITGVTRSHALTRANIAEAAGRAIPLRVGVIGVDDAQDVEETFEELAGLGVGEIRVDYLRQVGRGVRDRKPDLSQLCGHCGRDKVAVAADGSIWPCVFSRWLPVGNVRQDRLADILAGPAMAGTMAMLGRHFQEVEKHRLDPCDPQCGPSCGPACTPSCWPTGAGPCSPRGGCQPNYD